MLNPRTEDYLQTIGRLEERGEPATTSTLAKEHGVSYPSVTEAVHRLAEQGLVARRPRGTITLTEKGRRLASTVIRRHRLWERFLHDVLGLGSEKIHQEACRLEHATSDDVESRLASVLADTTACPHGRPIPERFPDPPAVASVVARGPATEPLPSPAVGVQPVVSETEDLPLSALKPDSTGQVVKLAAGRAFLTQCLALGFTPGVPVRMVQNFGRGPVIVEVRGARVALGRAQAHRILVARKGQSLGILP